MGAMGKRLSGRQILATNMRQLRLARGWSQEDLAETCELHRTYIGAIERGERNVSIDNIDRIARAFGLAIGDLLTPQPKR
jgi:transcriptional regulator with XRE-family HTH domain